MLVGKHVSKHVEKLGKIVSANFVIGGKKSVLVCIDFKEKAKVLMHKEENSLSN